MQLTDQGKIATRSNIETTGGKTAGYTAKTDSSRTARPGDNGMEVTIKTTEHQSNVITSGTREITVRINSNGEIVETRQVPGNAVAPPSGVRYRVQIAAVNKPVDTANTFSGLSQFINQYGIYYVKEGGLYKYLIGDFSSFNEAFELCDRIKKSGRDCFVKVINSTN